MLQITIGQTESYDESTSEFVQVGGTPIELEHSLVSISKWESKWEIPFVSDAEKTDEQTLDYIGMMITSPNPPSNLMQILTDKDIIAINAYIGAKMTATWFGPSRDRPGKKQVITSEVLYSWMISLNIPVEFENWHLARLLTLIRVCNEHNSAAQPNKKSAANTAASRKAINDARRKQYGTTG